MERTPFDADASPDTTPTDSAPLAPDDNAPANDALDSDALDSDAPTITSRDEATPTLGSSAPAITRDDNVAFAPADVPDEDSSAPRALPRWFWPAFGAIVLVLAMAGAGIWAGKRAENARLAELRERVNAIARNDNALVLEILGADGSQTITYAEFFARAAKNKSDRDILIRKLRTMVAPPYQTEVDNLVRLLEIENDYVRAEEAVTRQKLEVAQRRNALQQIADANADAQSGLDAPYVAPSGEEVGAPLAVGPRGAGAAFRRYKAAREAMSLKLNAATQSIDSWLDAEPRLYPQWAPPRNVTDALQAKKRRYNIATPDPNAEPNAPLNPDPNAPVSPDFAEPPAPEEPAPEPPQPEIEPAPETPSVEEPAPDAEPMPEPTTEPTPEAQPPTSGVPTRDDAPAALPGERFSQTRLREVTPDELSGLSDQDLRYATNEMFARYGQTFGDKSYQAQFEAAPWYRPNPDLSSAKIRRSFSDLEKRNLKQLIQERDRRKAIARGY